MAYFQAIPTKYNGVQFRSRLEARWACVFDALKIEWQYEPFDLKGYIPDFIIKDIIRKSVLIEVKPSTQIIDLLRFTEEIGKVWDGAAAIVTGAHEVDDGYYCVGIGRESGHQKHWMQFVYEFCHACGKYQPSFMSGHDSSYVRAGCYYCGDVNGNQDGSGGDNFLKIWNEAGAKVQWHGK